MSDIFITFNEHSSDCRIDINIKRIEFIRDKEYGTMIGLMSGTPIFVKDKYACVIEKLRDALETTTDVLDAFANGKRLRRDE